MSNRQMFSTFVIVKSKLKPHVAPWQALERQTQRLAKLWRSGMLGAQAGGSMNNGKCCVMAES